MLLITYSLYTHKKKECCTHTKKECVINYVSFMLQIFFFLNLKVRHVIFLSYQIWEFIELITQYHGGSEFYPPYHWSIGHLKEGSIVLVQ